MFSRIKTYLKTFSKFNWNAIGNGHGVLVLLDCIKSRIVDGTNTEQFITLEFYRKVRGKEIFVTNRKTVNLEKLSMEVSLKRSSVLYGTRLNSTKIQQVCEKRVSVHKGC